jgi:hypothetical protein
MSLTKSIRLWLLDVPGVANLIGDEIYPEALGEGYTLPAVVVRTLSTRHEHHLLGRAGLATSLVSIDVLSNRAAQARDVATVISNSGITRVHGSMKGTNVRSVMHSDGPSSGEVDFPVDGGEEMRGYISSLSFEFSYVEPSD